LLPISIAIKKEPLDPSSGKSTKSSSSIKYDETKDMNITLQEFKAWKEDCLAKK
jgi:hypothetical protein